MGFHIHNIHLISNHHSFCVDVHSILRPGGLFVFIEPDSGSNLIGDIKQVFPETIKVKTTSAKSELKESSSPKSSKKRRKIEESMTPDETGASSDNDSAVAIEYSLQSTEEDSSSAKQASKSRTKQGLSFERIDNYNIEPYIVGIAIKPY